MTLSSYVFTDTDNTFGAGEWTMMVSNNETADQQVDSFFLRLVYK